MDGAVTDRRPPPTDPADFKPMPAIDMRHILRMTDDTGMLQHGLYTVPDPNHGYCADDNARALIAALLHADLTVYDEQTVPLVRYLTFLTYAFNDETRTLRNFMAYDRRWLEAVGSDDSQGRTIWALGLTVKLAPNDAVRDLAVHLVERALPGLDRLQSPRAKAFMVVGLSAYLDATDDHRVRSLRDALVENLFRSYEATATDDWPWWEPTVTYANAKLPQALLVGGAALGNDEMIDAGCRALGWLLEVQTAPAGHLSIIGSDRWMTREHKSQFAQQPVEAQALVEACLSAAQITGERRWADHAWRCFRWFVGDNDLGVPLYNPDTGGCHDGLERHGPNQNQGAESTLAYALSVLQLHRYRRDAPADP